MPPLLSSDFGGNHVEAQLDCITQVIATPNSMFSASAGKQKKRAGVLHDVESPSGRYAVPLAQGWLRSGEPHSVQLIIDGFDVVQLLDLESWCWGAGGAVNTNTIQIEQAGYVTFSTAQWLGTAAVGSTYRDLKGNDIAWTAENNRQMSAQFVNVATCIAQINHLEGWGVPRHGTQQDMADYLNGVNVGVWFGHYDVSMWAFGTNHSDPHPNYPWVLLMQLAGQIYNGTSPTPAPPTGDWFDNMDEKTLDAKLAANNKALLDALFTNSMPGESVSLLSHLKAQTTAVQTLAGDADNSTAAIVDLLTRPTGVIPKLNRIISDVETKA